MKRRMSLHEATYATYNYITPRIMLQIYDKHYDLDKVATRTKRKLSEIVRIIESKGPKTLDYRRTINKLSIVGRSSVPLNIFKEDKEETWWYGSSES